MEKVEKYISEAMIWLNSKMNAQNKLSLTQDPVVKVSEIVAKSKVRNHTILFLRGSSMSIFLIGDTIFYFGKEKILGGTSVFLGCISHIHTAGF